VIRLALKVELFLTMYGITGPPLMRQKPHLSLSLLFLSTNIL
jgi:hypothetical protein